MPEATVTRELRKFLAVPTLTARVVSGPDAGLEATVSCETLTVGTAQGNDLKLTDRTVSGYHLELRRLDQGLRVDDLDSTNGTWVGAVRIERAVVEPGCQLTIGDSQLVLAGGEDALVELHESDQFGTLRGASPNMRRMMARVAKAATTEAAVLLIGESGTGKELLAQAIHERSPRREGPFVTVDCGALAPNLVASELFGHERGAFTGADTQRIGAFERAAGGTLFLDEIGDLPADLQSYLLGALERRTLRRVGGRDEIPIDVRIIAATHRDLRAAVNTGTFRLDLYYRLAVASFEVPPLRERASDIPLLVSAFLEQLAPHLSVSAIAPPEVMARLVQHRWPGNVRELRNLVEAAVALDEPLAIGQPTASDDAVITGRALDELAKLDYREARAQVVTRFERGYLERLLERAEGNVSKAARVGHINRAHLNELLRKHNLR